MKRKFTKYPVTAGTRTNKPVKANTSDENGSLIEFVNRICSTRLPKPAGTHWKYEMEEDAFGGDVAELHLVTDAGKDVFMYNISDWNPDTDELVNFNDPDVEDEIVDDLMIHFDQTLEV